MKKNLEMKRSRVVEEFRADIIRLYRNAAKFQHSHETIMANVNAIRLRPEFKKLPLYHQARIEGFLGGLWQPI